MADMDVMYGRFDPLLDVIVERLVDIGENKRKKSVAKAVCNSRGIEVLSIGPCRQSD